MGSGAGFTQGWTALEHRQVPRTERAGLFHPYIRRAASMKRLQSSTAGQELRIPPSSNTLRPAQQCLVLIVLALMCECRPACPLDVHVLVKRGKGRTHCKRIPDPGRLDCQQSWAQQQHLAPIAEAVRSQVQDGHDERAMAPRKQAPPDGQHRAQALAPHLSLACQLANTLSGPERGSALAGCLMSWCW